MEAQNTLLTILNGFSRQKVANKPKARLRRFSVSDRKVLLGKKAEMTVLANPLHLEQIYQVVNDEEGVVTPIGRCFASQVIYPVFGLTQTDPTEIGYMLLDGAGLYCYDASGGGFLFTASAQSVMLANYNPIEMKIAFQVRGFSGVSVEGLLGCVWEGKVIPFAEVPSGQEIVADSLAFTFVSRINEEAKKIGVCPTGWVKVEQLEAGRGKFLQPVWNSGAFEEEFFNVDEASLVGLLVR